MGGRYPIMVFGAMLAVVLTSTVVPAAQPQYDLPAECSAFAAEHDKTWDAVGDQMEANWFFDVEALCEQYFLAKKSAKIAKHDYISNLDFATLTLDQIPYVSCEIHAFPRPRLIWCHEFDNEFPTLSQAHFLIYWQLFHANEDFSEATVEDIATARAVPVDDQTCRLERKKSGEWLYMKRNLNIWDGKVGCVEAPAREIYLGFSIDPSKTLFRDVDSDGWMDALLIMRDYGGDHRVTVTRLIIMTKKQPGPAPLTKVRFKRRWGGRR